ncbi:hypothetical protein O6H91_05G130400 [Diphasiastrum complanatum]|uniref:Uncharacterized protein n=1 Tax=Diphasiastrum complanatum TaxID=34168 RepID=A0ACC2DTQ9_DIPCM|nr:hypothetical protein O6H91_05G130400 [Diphasiastrum complanatum]
MADENEKVLSYGDVLLRRGDVELLGGPYYLNDHIIEFFFCYLASSPASPSDSSSDPVLLVGPSITFWLMHCPDPDGLRAAIAPLKLRDRQLVLFAVNNNEDVEEAGGGSHWSLLAYDRRQNVFNHYDSMKGMNWRHADDFISIVKPFLGSKASAARLVEPSSPQQENGYDCGVYVMAIAQVLWDSYHENMEAGKGTQLSDLLHNQVTADFVSRMRETTLELIYTLARSQ